MDIQFIVTTVYNPGPKLVNAAQQWAEKLKTIWVPRERRSLQSIMEAFHTEIILVSSQEGPVVYTPGGRYFFHLSMAELRIKNWVNGKHDHMATAMGLVPGMSVLDCTLGLASDAIVASYISGVSGSVVGIEKSPVLALIAALGLQNFTSDTPEVTAALRRIHVFEADYSDYLATIPSKSFDIVFFDPMFKRPVQSSSNLKPLRYLAEPRPLDRSSIQTARRIAKKRVVIKEANGSDIFRQLGISTLAGGKYSSVQYGILEADY
jgi:16S rRNA G966 N2-methylase RsmD